MKIILAKSAGFCYGVSRAVSICEEAADTCKNCVTFGPIIHNEHVINALEAKGVRTVNDISEVSSEDTVIIRSHGAGKAELDALEALGAKIIDATCPDVRKIHEIVQAEAQSGRYVLIIGRRNHPEIVAISGWCENYEIFETPEELSEWLKRDNHRDLALSVVLQTTNTMSVYKACEELIKKECTNVKIFDTICNATLKRQQEAVEISTISNVVIVVGDYSSANSLKLVDICGQHCSRVFFVQSVNDLERTNIHCNDVVGITAGASTPAFIIKEVAQKMAERANEEILEEMKTEEPDLNATEIKLEEDVSPGDEHTQEPVSQHVENVPEQVDTNVAEESSETKDTEVDLPVQESDTEDSAEASGNSDDGESFEEMLEKSIKTLRTGEKVTGIVSSLSATEVSVELGAKQSAYIPVAEFIDDETTDINDVIKVGDTIEAFVMRVNDVEGMIMLSKKRLDAIKNWDTVESAKDNKTIVEGLVVEENKGGIVVSVKGVRVFVPASQTGLPKTAPMTDLLKKQVKLRITEVNQSRRRVVGSIRDVQRDERREKAELVWADIEVGKSYNGVVKSMTTYGVFVDIGGVDGMIHVSELSWTRIKQPSEIMSIGDEVVVYILSFDKETRKISLGYKKSEDNPWTKFTDTYAVGDNVNVTIVKLMPFGAFAEICPGVDGLIHISQIADYRIALPSDVLAEGQVVEVRITEIDNERKKVSLSMREATSRRPSQEFYDEEESFDDSQPESELPQESLEQEVVEPELEAGTEEIAE